MFIDGYKIKRPIKTNWMLERGAKTQTIPIGQSALYVSISINAD